MFANVAIPRSAPEPLTYGIPEPYRPMVVPGTRVRVPLRNRTATGVVVRIDDTTPLDLSVVRDIEEVLDVEPLLPAHLLDLAEFIATYYRCPLGDTLAAMLPASLLRADAERVELTATGAAADTAVLTPLQAAVLDALRASPRLSMAALMARTGAATRAPVTALATLGLLRIRRIRRDRAPRSEVAAVRLGGGALDEQRQACARAARQLAVVEWMAELGRPALISEATAATGCSAGVIRALVTKGVLQRFTQAPQAPSRWALPGRHLRHRLTDEQRVAVDAVAAAIAARKFTPLLLEGVTGSGKTEVYLRGLEAVLATGRGGIVLVPEIGLTPAASGAVERRFGDQAAVLHSAQTDRERWLEWLRVQNGSARIVVGPRSALFAPMASPGLIVVDEEHDAAYKQQESPRYHARDLALVLGQRLGVPVLLCAATPSVEAAALVRRDLARRLRLTRRVAGGSLPEVDLVDLRGEPAEPGEQGRTLFSRSLRSAIAETLERGEQIILLMQRRGWAPVLMCRDCGHQIRCEACSVPLVVHSRSRDLRCHYCGQKAAIPRRCPTCSGNLLDPVGAGTEKVAHHLRRLFPGVAAAILDRDTVRRRNGLEETLGAFSVGKAQVLVGTQMVAKGHHFPNVTLTGVISADAQLNLPDFRAGERTFQLLTQVAGRAGRGTKPGRVIIQTYFPDHPAVRHACSHDVASFMEEEMVFRHAFFYPPAARMALIRFEATAERRARDAAEAAAGAVDPVTRGVRLRGPAPAPIERLRSHWRWQVILCASNRELLREALDKVEGAHLPSGVRRIVDVDPLSTL